MDSPRTARIASEKSTVSDSNGHEKKGPTRHLCTLCGSTFRSRHRYKLYCSDCRGENEVLRFSEWLPAMADSVDPDLDIAA